jgi:hypothetical protein
VSAATKENGTRSVASSQIPHRWAHASPSGARERPFRPMAEKRPIDEGMAVARYIGGEHPDQYMTRGNRSRGSA